MVASRLTRRQALGGGAAGALLLTPLSACGQAATESKPAASASDVSGRVTYLSSSPGGDTRQTEEQKLFGDFNTQHPKLQVDVLVGAGGWSQAKEKFIVSAASGQPLDLTQNGWGVWTDLSDGGVITDLTPFFKRDKVNLSDFIDGAVQAYTIDGKTWAMPVSLSADALFYNADLFTAAGLPVPPQNPEDKTWTVEKFLELATKLTKGTDQFGYGGSVSSSNNQGLSCGTYFGQQPWDDAKRKCLMDQPNAVKGLQFFQDLIWKYRVAPNGDQNTALKGSLGSALYSGKIAMNQVGPFNPPKLDFKWGLAALPYSGQGKNQSARIWAHGLHLAKVKNPDAAWEVLKWLAKPENGGRFPLSAGHAVSPLLKGSDLAQKAYMDRHGVDHKAFALQAQNTHVSANGLARYTFYNDVDTQLTPEYTKVQNNGTAPAEYAKRATEFIDRAAGTTR